MASADSNLEETEDDFVVLSKSEEDSSTKENQETEEGDGAFSLLRQEQEALRATLLNQQEILSTGFDSLRSIQTQKQNQVCELKKELAALSLELEQTKLEKESLKNELKISHSQRGEIDELTAKLLHSEDMVKYQEDLLRGMGGGARSPEDPSALLESAMSRELHQKQQKIRKLESSLRDKESELMMEKEKSGKAEKEAEELHGLIAVYQDQAKEDQEFLKDLKSHYENEVVALRKELNRYKNPSPPINNSTLRCESCGQEAGDETLHLRHIERCKPSVDNID